MQDQEKKDKLAPIGIYPYWLHLDIRRKGLIAAISRYADAGLSYPIEWCHELTHITNWFENQEAYTRSNIF